MASVIFSLCVLFVLPLPAEPVPSSSNEPKNGQAAVRSRPVPVLTEKEMEAATLTAGSLGFSEVWAYLMDGEERFFKPEFPVTDIGYFGAGINSQGKLAGVPVRSKIRNCSRRVHLVIADLGNYALAHFCFSPEYKLRAALISDIVLAAQDYEGVQLDFEAVASADRDNYLQFAKMLKSALGTKTLSVALPAATLVKEDRFGYRRFAGVADRIIVMAYDEHWSTSAPGPVASMDWCSKVADYALSQIPSQQLVMGAPFYGRSWADKSLSKAYRFSSLSNLLDEKGIEDADIQRHDGVPFLEYDETVKVRVYFDDAWSTANRLRIYRKKHVWNIAFWRLGQEDASVWKFLSVENEIWPTGKSTGLSTHLPSMMR